MTHPNRARLSKLTLGLLAVLATAPVFAQSTSAGLGGQVIGADGQPVAGAEVIIVHAESGTVNRVSTDANGRYNARGLRVGGPYTVTVSKAGDGSTSRENLYLALDEVSQFDARLDDNVTNLGTVEAVALAGSDIFSADKMGTGTNYSLEQIQSAPTISRSYQDVARLDPRLTIIDDERGGSISAAGQNSRFNSITVDSVSVNDEFGLNDNGVAALNQPFSIDTIESISVDLANYDVTQSDFTGASINAVTKSGTNEFSGSVYYIYRDKDMFGEIDSDGDGDDDEFDGFSDEITAGATLGGPIIKDTLFFFLAYEEFTRTSPGPGLNALSVGNVSQAELDRIAAIAQGYGLDVGGLTTPPDLENSDEKILAKVDWNINDAHRLSARYSETIGNQINIPYQFQNGISFSSHWYASEISYETFATQLYSNWSDNFSTEISVSRGDYLSAPVLNARAPQTTVDVDSGAGVRFGSELFRHANRLENEYTNAHFIGDLFLGDHTIRFGADYKDKDIFNLFVFGSLGQYAFDSIDDFEAGNYSFYQLRTTPNPDGSINDAAAQFGLRNVGLFVQDTWWATNNLSVNYGLRLDTPSVDGRPLYNPRFEAAYGFRNDGTVDGNHLLQPRLGFNYTFNSDLPTQLRGGVGLFQGSTPDVWLSNAFTNPGGTVAVFRDFDGSEGYSADPDNQPRPGGVSGGVQDVDVVSPDFEQPAVWRANLAFDTELPWWGLVLTTELLLTDVENGIFYQHLNLGAPSSVLPDGRVAYWESTDPSAYRNPYSTRSLARANAAPGFNDVLLLRNTSKGRAQNLTLSLEKPLTDRWHGRVAYTFGNSTEVNPGTSSRAISNWNNNAVFNANEEVSATSNYEVQDRFTALLGYKRNFFADLATSMTLFYEGRRGRGYSFVYANDANGDRINDNDLFYIPLGPGDVEFTPGSDVQGFWDFIANDEYLNSHRGQVAGRNDANSPWVNRFDLNFSQELPGFFKGNSEIFVNILNVGNLINDEWGRVEEVPFSYVRGVAGFAGVNPETGKYVYDFTRGGDEVELRDGVGQSRWSAQVGFRYNF